MKIIPLVLTVALLALVVVLAGCAAPQRPIDGPVGAMGQAGCVPQWWTCR